MLTVSARKMVLAIISYALNDNKGKPSQGSLMPTVSADASRPSFTARRRLFDKPRRLLTDRLMLAMAMEMVHCLGGGRSRLTSRGGYGASLRGRLSRHSAAESAAGWMRPDCRRVCDRGDKYAHISELYRPTEKLRAMAAKGETLY